MANRHHNRKLRAEIHARMARTGESYQKARNAILALPEPSQPAVELMSTTSFGVPVTLATFEGDEFSSFSLLRAWRTGGGGYWLPTMRFLRPRGEN